MPSWTTCGCSKSRKRGPDDGKRARFEKTKTRKRYRKKQNGDKKREKIIVVCLSLPHEKQKVISILLVPNLAAVPGVHAHESCVPCTYQRTKTAITFFFTSYRFFVFSLLPPLFFFCTITTSPQTSLSLFVCSSSTYDNAVYMLQQSCPPFY